MFVESVVLQYRHSDQFNFVKLAEAAKYLWQLVQGHETNQ